MAIYVVGRVSLGKMAIYVAGRVPLGR